MPKFLLPVIVLSLISLTGFGYVTLSLSPDQKLSVTLFILTLFLSLTFLFSLLLFFVHQRFFFRPKTFTALGPAVTDDELRSLFRTSLRRAIMVAVVVTGLLLLRKLV